MRSPSPDITCTRSSGLLATACHLHSASCAVQVRGNQGIICRNSRATGVLLVGEGLVLLPANHLINLSLYTLIHYLLDHSKRSIGSAGLGGGCRKIPVSHVRARSRPRCRWMQRCERAPPSSSPVEGARPRGRRPRTPRGGPLTPPQRRWQGWRWCECAWGVSGVAACFETTGWVPLGTTPRSESPHPKGVGAQAHPTDPAGARPAAGHGHVAVGAGDALTITGYHLHP